MGFLKSITTNLINRKKSLESKLFIIQGALVLFWLIGIIIILITTGVFGTLNTQSYNTLDRELNRTVKSLSDRLIIISQSTYNLTKDINKNINYTLKEKRNSITNIIKNEPLLTLIIDSQVEKSLYAMEKSGSSGVFLVLNATINSTIANSECSKAGFYIKDTNPSHISYISDFPVLLRGSSEIAKKYGMYLDTEWQLEFYFDNILSSKYFNVPFNMAIMYPDKDIKELSYFSIPFYPDTNQKRVMSFSVPLIDKSGIIYGVCGLEISEQFLNEFLISSNTEDDICYILAPKSKDNSIYISDSIIFGKKDNDILCDDILTFKSNSDTYNEYISKNNYKIEALEKELNIYSSANININEKWVLLAYSLKKSEPISQTKMLTIAIIILTLITLTLAFKMSKVYTKPIKTSFEQITNNQNEIKKTHILEIDALIDFIADINSETPTNTKNSIKTTSSAIYNDKYKEFKTRLSTLTKTEKLIFDLHIKGLSTNEILTDRCISISTLKTHNTKIYAKMKVKSRSELLSYCYQIMNNQEINKL